MKIFLIIGFTKNHRTLVQCPVCGQIKYEQGQRPPILTFCKFTHGLNLEKKVQFRKATLHCLLLRQ